MSQKTERKHRQVVRKNYQFQYVEFLEFTETLKFSERFRMAWAALFKLGALEKRRRKKYLKKQQKKDKKGKKK